MSPWMARLMTLVIIALPLISLGVLLFALHNATAQLNDAWSNQ